MYKNVTLKQYTGGIKKWLWQKFVEDNLIFSIEKVRRAKMFFYNPTKCKPEWGDKNKGTKSGTDGLKHNKPVLTTNTVY